MKFFSSTLVLAAISLMGVNAVPVAEPSAVRPSGALLGPAPYEELKAQVAALNEGVKERGLEKRTLGGLYLCDSEYYSNLYS